MASRKNCVVYVHIFHCDLAPTSLHGVVDNNWLVLFEQLFVGQLMGQPYI